MRCNSVIGVLDRDAVGFRVLPRHTREPHIPAAACRPAPAAAEAAAFRQVAMEVHPVAPSAATQSNMAPALAHVHSHHWIPVALAWLLGVLTACSIG